MSQQSANKNLAKIFASITTELHSTLQPPSVFRCFSLKYYALVAVTQEWSRALSQHHTQV